MPESPATAPVGTRLAALDRHPPERSVAEPLSPSAGHRPASAIHAPSATPAENSDI
jgi:hypothetical protein